MLFFYLVSLSFRHQLWFAAMLLVHSSTNTVPWCPSASVPLPGVGGVGFKPSSAPSLRPDHLSLTASRMKILLIHFYVFYENISSTSHNNNNVSFPIVSQWVDSYEWWRSDLSGLGGQSEQRDVPRFLHPPHSVNPAWPDGEQPAVLRTSCCQTSHTSRLQVS